MSTGLLGHEQPFSVCIRHDADPVWHRDVQSLTGLRNEHGAKTSGIELVPRDQCRWSDHEDQFRHYDLECLSEVRLHHPGRLSASFCAHLKKGSPNSFLSPRFKSAFEKQPELMESSCDHEYARFTKSYISPTNIFWSFR
jgi:hypothetical protein